MVLPCRCESDISWKDSGQKSLPSTVTQMTSANSRSVFRKYMMPEKRRMSATPHESAKEGQYNGVLPANSAHRKPSMIPTTGLSEYSSRHESGIRLLLKPTGETYRPNWTTNGTRYLTSRYLTFSAAIHSPVPTAAATI